jgi:hypothetical protein
MRYMKATVVGIVSGLLLAILWVLAAIWVPIYAAMFLSQLRHEGAGGGAAYVGSGSVMLAAFVGFAAGFYWTVRRARHRRPAE